jgi:hypothetical protein
VHSSAFSVLFSTTTTFWITQIALHRWTNNRRLINISKSSLRLI